MWRLTMFLLCLIAAVSGTPLRQAEAASDFIRSFGEFGPGNSIETIDGGVGDDPEASILNAGDDTQSRATAFPSLTAGVDFTSPILLSSLPSIGNHRPGDLVGSLAASSDRRFASLQCFLF